MELVVNDVVKMEWDKAGWLQTVPKQGKKPVFIFASKVYDSTKAGKITLFFAKGSVFVMSDDEGYYSAKDMAKAIKDLKDMDDFPFYMDGYDPIIDEDEDEANADALAAYGLEAYEDDINKRYEDILPYTLEYDVEM